MKLENLEAKLKALNLVRQTSKDLPTLRAVSADIQKLNEQYKRKTGDYYIFYNFSGGRA